MSGHITLDELVALSQGASAIAAAKELELLTAATAMAAKAAVSLAATRTLQAAEEVRDARTAAAMKIALVTAEVVRQAAHLLQLQADEDALGLTGAAERAASRLASAILPDTAEVKDEKAALILATGRAAAVAKVEETALAAATVARAAATAAADAAAIAADAAMALELQVGDTAAAMHPAATASRESVLRLRPIWLSESAI